MKKIYLVERTDEIGYDEYDSWIVRAKSKSEAIKLSFNWGNGRPDKSDLKVSIVSLKGKSKAILGSFNAG